MGREEEETGFQVPTVLENQNLYNNVLQVYRFLWLLSLYSFGKSSQLFSKAGMNSIIFI
jgi:hypothetical protein